MEVSGWGTGERKFHRSTRPRGGRCSSVERPAFVSPTQELVSTQKLQLLIQTSFSLGTQISLFSENVFWAWVYIYQFWNYIRCCKIFFNPEHCLYPSRSFEELQLGFSPACNKCLESFIWITGQFYWINHDVTRLAIKIGFKKTQF